MEIKIMSWNMAGAKLFEQLDPAPKLAAGSYTAAFRRVWENSVCPWLATPDADKPDIILLQECIGFKDRSSCPSGRWQVGSDILKEIFSEYDCFFFPAVTSHNNPHPGKWNRYVKGGSVANYIPAYIDVQQGYGICVRKGKGVSSRKLWVPWPDPKDVPEHADEADHHCISCFEPVNINTGLYLGNRDTEPRMVIMGRAKLESDGQSRYLNYLNIHLSTLSGEREGNVRLNRSATTSRLQQVELILDNIVSAYQEMTDYRIPKGTEQSERDIWIIGGDFNTTPNSVELTMIQHSGFIDAIPDKRIEDADVSSALHGQAGSKWSLDDPESPAILLDYIFCGLEQFTFPTGGLDLSESKRPFRPHFENAAFASDHAILLAKIKL
jgi:endonuclease/exonuclease/phosphatase family metal-dependent hydrolase